MEIFIRILLAVFVVVGVYSVVYGLVYSLRYRGAGAFVEWNVYRAGDCRVPVEILLRGLVDSAERSCVPVRAIIIHMDGLSAEDEEVCRRFKEKYSYFTFETDVSRETF